MEIIFYITIFLIGLITGSFFTLAIHRIPLHENITCKRSYCPKCKHQLSFWDMIPVISYIFLGGKCRYCKKKISSTYIKTELLTGIVFVLLAISICGTKFVLNEDILIYLIFNLLYVSGLIIIASIDRKKGLINEGILLYELLIISIYIIYLYILGGTNIYRYVIYLFIMLTLLVNDTLYLKRRLKNNYTMQILLLSVIMACFVGGVNFLATAVITLFAIAIRNLLYKITKVKTNKNVPIAYLLCISNIMIIIVANMCVRWF